MNTRMFVSLNQPLELRFGCCGGCGDRGGNCQDNLECTIPIIWYGILLLYKHRSIHKRDSEVCALKECGLFVCSVVRTM